jgi:hypothetical protein
MIRLHMLVSLLVMAGVGAPFSATAGDGNKSIRDEIVGTWSLVSLVVNQGGQKIEPFGPNPRGIQMMDANGHFSNIITRESLPEYASGNRLMGRLPEYQAIGQGSNAMFGTYTVDEAANTINFHIDVSTFPNWEGVDQERAFTLAGDEWRYVNPMTTFGPGSVEVVWKRTD